MQVIQVQNTPDEFQAMQFTGGLENVQALREFLSPGGLTRFAYTIGSGRQGDEIIEQVAIDVKRFDDVFSMEKGDWIVFNTFTAPEVMDDETYKIRYQEKPTVFSREELELLLHFGRCAEDFSGPSWARDEHDLVEKLKNLLGSDD